MCTIENEHEHESACVQLVHVSAVCDECLHGVWACLAAFFLMSGHAAPG